MRTKTTLLDDEEKQKLELYSYEEETVIVGLASGLCIFFFSAKWHSALFLLVPQIIVRACDDDTDRLNRRKFDAPSVFLLVLREDARLLN